MMGGVSRDHEANFARRVAELRTREGFSQSELARRMIGQGFANYSQMTVSRTEKGERPIRLSEARALAEILGEDLESMMRDKPVAELSLEMQELESSLIISMFKVAQALVACRTIGEAVDDIELQLSLLGDEADVDRARAQLASLASLRFPLEVVAAWAAEVAEDVSRDPYVRELQVSDVQRMKKLADGLDQAEA